MSESRSTRRRADAAGPAPVVLGTAADFAVLAGSAVTGVGAVLALWGLALATTGGLFMLLARR
jgi:hypothetical protein